MTERNFNAMSVLPAEVNQAGPLAVTPVQKAPSEHSSEQSLSAGFSNANPTDAQFSNQWHLLNTTAGLLDLNVVPVWDDYTGTGISAWVLDDGFDFTHTDLSANYNQALDIDYEQGDNNAAPLFTADNHGTSVMGIIGAARNGSGAVGIAYNAELVGIRGYSDDQASTGTLDGYVTAIGDGARYAADNGADVLNMSNGYGNVFNAGLNVAGVNATLADFDYAVDTGRGGLGLNIVKSAGNNRSQLEDINMKAVDNTPFTISVAAVNQDGFVSDYSSFGSALLVSGFGTPGEVVTTDRTGAAGYTANDINPGFNGTSSAAPMVAGVVALILDANEALGWRDVQEILANTARHVGSAIGASTVSGSEFYLWGVNGSNTWNGGGMHFSNDYGFGLVDALAATRLAETWLYGRTAATSANQAVQTLDLLNTTLAIPDANLNGTAVSAVETDNLTIEYTTISVSMSVNHTAMSHLNIIVVSPDGTQSIIHNGTGGTQDFPGTWTFSTFAFKGENAIGTWSVFFQDLFTGEVGTLSDVVVRNHGRVTANDIYVFTNEYSEVLNTGRTQINDTNGGNDTFNASAVSFASRVNLNSGWASIIDGVVLTTDGSIENAVGGDGFDMLIGNAAANRLYGMRGDDTLEGGAGNDTLTGGTGNDTYVNPVGDTIVELSGEGIDTVQTSSTFSIAALPFIENIRLTGAANVNAAGNDFGNRLLGNSGNNILNGGLGADTMTGGTGNDIYYVNTSADQVIESAGQGTDLISSSTSLTLVANVENLNLSGTANLSGNGNTLANIINGNSGNNILRGDVGNDTLNGGAGEDILLGGAGRDTLNPGTDATRDIIRFSAVSDSTGINRDTVIGMDLNADDRFDFTVVPGSIGVQVNTGTLSTASFDANIAAAVNAGLAVNGAILFDPSAGDLNIAGHRYLIVDVDGNGSYTAGADYIVQLVNATGTLTLDDFT
jgi:subtilisin family serine protease